MMEPSIKNNADTFCRACMILLQHGDGLDTLESINVKHNIFCVANLAEKLADCTSLPLESTDKYSNYLCDCCYGRVNDFHQFRVMCTQSLKRFEELQQLRESLNYDDEKPNFDLNGKIKMEVLVEESKLVVIQEEPQLFKKCEEADLKSVNTNKRRKKQRNVRNIEFIKINETAESLEAEIFTEEKENPIAVKTDVKSNPKPLHKSFTAFNSHALNEFACPKDNDSNAIKTNLSKPKAVSNKCTEDNNPYQCDVCPARFFVEHRFVAHKRKHDGLTPYPCPRDNCNKSFNRPNRLKDHLKQHDGTNNWYICEHEGCGRVYRHKPSLIMHQRKCHQIGPELKQHVCEICGKVLGSSTLLANHRYTHQASSERPHACNEPNCQRRFTNKEKLRVHMMRHAGIKNYVCPHCGVHKTTRTELTVHINFHTMERTWPCGFCTHVCHSAGNLRTHIRVVHERAKNYACRFCDRKFGKPGTRKHHEMTHTGEKPNECDECGKRFIQATALRTHKKMHQRKRIKLDTATAAHNSGNTNTV